MLAVGVSALPANERSGETMRCRTRATGIMAAMSLRPYYAVRRPLWTLMLAPVLVLACTERPSDEQTSASGSSSSSPDSSSTGPTTGTSLTTTTNTSMSASGSTSASESSDSTDGATGTTTSTSAASITEATTGSTTVSTTEATTAPLTGTDSGSSESSGAMSSSTGGTDGLVLDPSTLVMFELPINSIRYAVSGHDPEHNTCVSIIFSYPGVEEHCDDFKIGENGDFPYVVITPGGAPPCMDWDYGGNVTVDAASGCMQVTKEFPLAISIDMNLSVSGDIFTGTIAVSNK